MFLDFGKHKSKHGPFKTNGPLPALWVFVSYKKYVWICNIDRGLMNQYCHYLLWLRSDSIFLTDPYRQCEFPDASGCFLTDNLMRGSLWQVDGVSFHPAQSRSAGACVQASPIDAFRKNARSVKTITFYPFLFFSLLKRL